MISASTIVLFTDAEVGTVYGSGNGDFTLVRTGNQLSLRSWEANIYAVAIGDVNVAQSMLFPVH